MKVLNKVALFGVLGVLASPVFYATPSFAKGACCKNKKLCKNTAKHEKCDNHDCNGDCGKCHSKHKDSKA